VSDNPVRVNEVLTMFAQLDLGKIAQPTVECPLSICSDGIYGEASSCYQHVNPRDTRLSRGGAGVRQPATHTHELTYEGSRGIAVRGIFPGTQSVCPQFVLPGQYWAPSRPAPLQVGEF